jgi:hypothetical protein
MITEEARGWHGYRLTLNCGDFTLTADRYWIGQLISCHVCPLTTHNPAQPGVPSVPVRQIVAVDPVWAPQKPDAWGPEHWHGA